jgi:hypothetical protein
MIVEHLRQIVVDNMNINLFIGGRLNSSSQFGIKQSYIQNGIKSHATL